MSLPRVKSQRKIKSTKKYEDEVGFRKNNKKVKLNKSLKYCEKIIQELLSRKNYSHAWPFHKPVDADLLGLTDYNSIIKNPMDLGTIKRKLNDGKYKSSKGFIDDMQLVFNNCYTYNPPHHPIVEKAKKIQKLFESRIVNLPEDPQVYVNDDDNNNNKIDQIYNETIKYRDLINSKITFNVLDKSNTLKLSNVNKEKIGSVQEILKAIQEQLKIFIDENEDMEKNTMDCSQNYGYYTIVSDSLSSEIIQTKRKRKFKEKLNRKTSYTNSCLNDHLPGENNGNSNESDIIESTPIVTTITSNQSQKKRSQGKPNNVWNNNVPSKADKNIVRTPIATNIASKQVQGKSTPNNIRIKYSKEYSEEKNPREIDDVAKKQENMMEISKRRNKNLIFIKERRKDKLINSDKFEHIESTSSDEQNERNLKLSTLPSDKKFDPNKIRKLNVVEQNIGCTELERNKKMSVHKNYKRKKLNLSKKFKSKKIILNENNNVVQYKNVPVDLESNSDSEDRFKNDQVERNRFKNDQVERNKKILDSSDHFIESSKKIKTSEMITQNSQHSGITMTSPLTFETTNMNEISRESGIMNSNYLTKHKTLEACDKSDLSVPIKNGFNNLSNDIETLSKSKIRSSTMLSEPDKSMSTNLSKNITTNDNMKLVANQTSKDLILNNDILKIESIVPSMTLNMASDNSIFAPIVENSKEISNNKTTDLINSVQIDKTYKTDTNIPSQVQTHVLPENIQIPMMNQSKTVMEQKKNDSIRVAGTKSWSSQEQTLPTSSSSLSLKSSDMEILFLSFKKQALEKALKEKQFEEQQKTKRENVIKKQNDFLYKIQKKKKQLEDLEKIKRMRNTEEMIEHPATDLQYTCTVEQHKIEAIDEIDVRMLERDKLRRQEQERRRREASETNIDLLMQSNVMADFEEIL